MVAASFSKPHQADSPVSPALSYLVMLFSSIFLSRLKVVSYSFRFFSSSTLSIVLFNAAIELTYLCLEASLRLASACLRRSLSSHSPSIRIRVSMKPITGSVLLNFLRSIIFFILAQSKGCWISLSACFVKTCSMFAIAFCNSPSSFARRFLAYGFSFRAISCNSFLRAFL